ncbi:MAG: Methionyl-tRNA formyltransferase [uncultured Solirubrobacteraceae bacterium]|uniref:Methionyl-tRNA formyltransferase n=1 Tax=uncultured Solirubrobacteraceae bacterium TaxID=1162706 RepID=A0A6J4RPR4_9ACTN|nr:MAG: Methionyl-tRNA formyltransferase [uncultured Solirubrobacteraceae bacterium]
MRHVFLGTSAFAAAVLERLVTGGQPPLLVVSRPDRPAGRGRRLSSPPVVEAARRLDLEAFQPEDLHAPETQSRLASLAPEALTVCAYGVLIREPLLTAFEVLNVHPSLLPRWRGAAPIERALMAGDATTGVSIMRLVEALDAGPICLQEPEPIRPDDDAGSLGERLQALGGELLLRALAERPPFHEQPDAGVTYAEKIESRDRLVDHGNPVAVEHRRVRALSPDVGARLELPDETMLGVRAARPFDAGEADAAQRSPVGPGVLGAVDGRLLLGCRDGALELLEVQPAGGRAMPASAWLNGRVGAALAQTALRLPPPPRT